MCDFDLKEPPTVEDRKARDIMDWLFRHSGEAEIGSLKSEIVDVLKLMSRRTFYEKLSLLEEDEWVRREARIKGTRAVAYIVVAGPVLEILRRRVSEPFAQLVAEAMKELTDPEALDEEKEGILFGLMKGYLGGSVDWILDVMRECLRAESADEAARALSLSTRYIFGLCLTQIGLLYWAFRPYGAGALAEVEEFFRTAGAAEAGRVEREPICPGGGESDLKGGR